MKRKMDHVGAAAEAVGNAAEQKTRPAEKTLKPDSTQLKGDVVYEDQDNTVREPEIEDADEAWAYQQELEQKANTKGKKVLNNYFAELAKLDISEHVEKKGEFSYLSWTWAVDRLRRIRPDASWEVKRFDGVPYLKTDVGYFVEVAVTVGGTTLSQIHPVLDKRNRPIPEPDAFDINTSIQRCLVKAIALHGLGLYIYAGEDLPEGAEPAKVTEEQQSHLQTLLEEVHADQNKFFNYFKIEKLADLPASEYQRAAAALEKKRKAAA